VRLRPGRPHTAGQIHQKVLGRHAAERGVTKTRAATTNATGLSYVPERPGPTVHGTIRKPDIDADRHREAGEPRAFVGLPHDSAGDEPEDRPRDERDREHATYGTQRTPTPLLRLNVFDVQNAAALRYQAW